MFFMSMAPRPHTTPSLDLSGEGVHAPVGGLGGHHVEWPWTSSASADGSVPSILATTLVRPLVRSSIRGSRPASASRSATYSAAGRSRQSPPPRLVVSIRISSEVKATTSSSAAVGSRRGPPQPYCSSTADETIVVTALNVRMPSYIVELV